MRVILTGKISDISNQQKIKRGQKHSRTCQEKLLLQSRDTQEFIYGVNGPGGSSFVITCQSNTTMNSRHGMIHAFNMSKLDGTLDQTVLDGFSRKHVILADVGTMDITDDSATEIALNVGAEDVRILREDSGSLLEFICDIHGFTAVENEIEGNGLEIISSKLEYLPNISVDLTESDHTSIEIFFEALRKTSEKPELVFSVTDVFHNINVQH